MFSSSRPLRFLRFLLFAAAFLTALSFATPATASAAAESPASPAVDSNDAETPKSLEVHFIDVGQGDAALIRSPSGKAILIDAGGPAAGAVVADYLEAQGVTSLDLAIGSHPHLDHLGGMLEVLQRVRPRIYMDPGFPHPLRQYDALLQWLEEEKVSVRLARAGRNITVEPGLVLEFLWPKEPLLSNTRSDANANSIVVRLVHGDVSFLFTGDAEAVTERQLLKQKDAVRATVLKVAHHGSRHSTSATWLKSVAPEATVMSLGATNSYGHPHPQLIDRLERAQVRVFRTDRDGDVIAYSDGRTVLWETTGERSAKLDEPGGRTSYGGKEIPSLPEVHQLVDVNTATFEELVTVPGIGQSLATKILDHRKRHGPFKTVSRLVDVNGIGKATLERIKPYVTVTSERSRKQRPRRRVAPPIRRAIRRTNRRHEVGT